MASKFIVPLELADYTQSPTNTADPSFGLVYLKNNWLKRASYLSIEKDLVLDHPLDGFSVLGSGAAAPISSSDTVLEAFEKIQQSLFITLTGDVTGTATYNDGTLRIATTVAHGGSSVPLTATKFDSYHTAALGNQYVTDDLVYYSGHIYKALANNDAITPVIGGNAYWNDLGAGFPYRQNVVDWNASSGDYQILNKPTNLSSFTNDVNFLTTESDPIFVSSAAYQIGSSDITNWNNAYTNMYSASTVFADAYAFEDIPAGHVVNVTTGFSYYSTYGLPGIANADKTGEDRSNNVLGIAVNNIDNGNIGKIVCKGPVYGLDTHTANVGDFAWVGINGNIQYGTRPTAPEHAVYIGVVTIKDSSNGSIFVDVQNGFEIDELHDVYIDYSTLRNYDLLAYDQTQHYWSNISLSAILGSSYTPSSRTLTINGISYDMTADRTWSIAPGGTTGQILAKNSSTDYDYTWINNYTELLYDTVKANDLITKGQAVYISGANGTNQLARLADNSNEQKSSKTLGLALQTMAINDIGPIVTQGLIAGIDTSAAAAGDPVWLGTSGNLIFGSVNKPVAPAHLVYIGVVTRANISNGEIYVRVQNGFELDELHNVLLTSLADNNILAYEASTGLWKNKSIPTVLGYTPVTNARTLTINGVTQDLSADRTFTVSTGNQAGVNLTNYYNFF